MYKNARIYLFSETLGVLVILLPWVFIAIAIHLNPWFHVNVNALSDLGGNVYGSGRHPDPDFPSVYNDGLILSGLVIGLFSISAIWNSRSRSEIIGLSFFILDGLFLALVGVYHEGTAPHVLLAEWFFLLGKVTFFILGFSLIIQRAFSFATALLLLDALAWLIEARITFVSVAEYEIYNVVIMDLLVLIYLLRLRATHALTSERMEPHDRYIGN
ncbi:MAG: DUF998 domain-containing protein [Candidatus Thermoplasmatota archaeon]|jgi:hypothetical membrane protein|nr:DUF998 domain-containing protein [Candidatus Thermoplasmatota archaeon]